MLLVHLQPGSVPNKRQASGANCFSETGALPRKGPMLQRSIALRDKWLTQWPVRPCVPRPVGCCAHSKAARARPAWRPLCTRTWSGPPSAGGQCRTRLLPSKASKASGRGNEALVHRGLHAARARAPWQCAQRPAGPGSKLLSRRGVAAASSREASMRLVHVQSASVLERLLSAEASCLQAAGPRLRCDLLRVSLHAAAARLAQVDCVLDAGRAQRRSWITPQRQGRACHGVQEGLHAAGEAQLHVGRVEVLQEHSQQAPRRRELQLPAHPVHIPVVLRTRVCPVPVPVGSWGSGFSRCPAGGSCRRLPTPSIAQRAARLVLPARLLWPAWPPACAHEHGMCSRARCDCASSLRLLCLLRGQSRGSMRRWEPFRLGPCTAVPERSGSGAWRGQEADPLVEWGVPWEQQETSRMRSSFWASSGWARSDPAQLVSDSSQAASSCMSRDQGETSQPCQPRPAWPAPWHRARDANSTAVQARSAGSSDPGLPSILCSVSAQRCLLHPCSVCAPH